ncbi:N-acetylmuramoyl-L-alanine amidase, partial [Alkalibaculum bacchi]|uniref:N-acetylmuramoyl-L-alanine amidase n=1 Tax=Alkalibaculum bacchi TaxID=645887 RepID=UPI0026EBBFBF
VSITITKPMPMSYIDTPTINEVIQNKPIRVSGWALNASGVKEVQVLVDGTVVGNAKIGLERGDVDKAYPGYTNGANSGFEYILDLTAIKPGSHNITARAVGVDGTSGSSVVSITITKPMPMSYIDTPTINEIVENKLIQVSGWALNASGIKEVQVLVDGTVVGNAKIGLEREDVDKAYPGYINGANSGFEYTLDVTAIKPGNHDITIKAIGVDGTSGSSATSITITKAIPLAYIDTPTHEENIDSNLSGQVRVSGWALNASGIKEIKVLLNGQYLGNANIGMARPDVSKVYPSYINGVNSGFEYILNSSKLIEGKNLITIQAIGVDSTFLERTVIVNTPYPQITIMLDPGHEGKYPLDPGAVGNGLYEYQLNNSLTKMIASKLESQGYNVIYTRNPSIEGPAPLKERDEKVNSLMPDLLISIHHDSSVNRSASGYSIFWSSYRYRMDKSGIVVTENGVDYPFVDQVKRMVNGSEETYIVYNKNGKNVQKNINDSDGAIKVRDRTLCNVAKESQRFANTLHSKLQTLDYINPRPNPVNNNNIYIIRETNVPTVLFEGGFISNPTEAQKINNTANQNKFANKVVEAINAYFK